MGTNHYKGQSNRLDEDELPDDVQAELSATFSPDIIYALVRDGYYRGPVSVGSGGERRVYGGGRPGSGLRRPDGPLYDYPESWRTSVLRKALELDLLEQVGGDDLDSGTFVAGVRGRDLLLTRDHCEECGRVNRPTLKDEGSSRRLTKVRTECPVHGNGGGYERPEDEVEDARRVVEEAEADVAVFLNDSSQLDEADPDGLQGGLSTGERVEVVDGDEEGRRGVVLPDLPLDPSDLRGVWSKRADDETVNVLLDRDEDARNAWNRRANSSTFHRNRLREVDENPRVEVPVFAEGQVVEKQAEGLDDSYVILRDLGNGWFEVGRREEDDNPDYLHAWELEPATRYVSEAVEDPEFEAGDEVRYFPKDDREKYRGHTAVVSEVRVEDYSPADGWTYFVDYEKEDRDGETFETWTEATAEDLEPEAEAVENDPDPARFSPGDEVQVDPEDHGYDEGTTFRVVRDDSVLDNPHWTGERYLYKVRPTHRRKSRSRREEMDVYEESLSPVEE